MYGKHFEQMYTGSMYGHGFATFAVWGWIISHAQDTKVEINPAILSHIFGEPESEIVKVIDYLCRPDSKSRTPDKDGRRLIRHGEYLYEVVNHIKYRQLAQESDRLDYKREWDRKKRPKRSKTRKSDTIRQHPTKSDAPTHTEAEANTETKTISASAFDVFWSKIPNKLGKGAARKAFKNALKATDAETILAGVEKYIAYEAGRKLQPDYRPLHPATWLNQERWGDILPEESVVAKKEVVPFALMGRQCSASVNGKQCGKQALWKGVNQMGFDYYRCGDHKPDGI